MVDRAAGAGCGRAPLPTVLSETALSNAFLGGITEVCIVTEDHRRTMAGLVSPGIGPFRVYTFDDRSLADPTYRGEDEAFRPYGEAGVARKLTWVTTAIGRGGQNTVTGDAGEAGSYVCGVGCSGPVGVGVRGGRRVRGDADVADLSENARDREVGEGAAG